MCISSSVNGLICYTSSIGKVCYNFQGIFKDIILENVFGMILYFMHSLNGMEVAGQRWVAQPAPVFPPEVIQALWGHPEERRQVIAAVYRLVQSIGDPIDMTYTKLTDKYYGGL